MLDWREVYAEDDSIAISLTLCQEILCWLGKELGVYEEDTSRSIRQNQERKRLSEEDVNQVRTESYQSPQSKGTLQTLRIAFALSRSVTQKVETVVLPADERLRRANVFQRAYTGRQSVSNQFVIVYVLPKNRPQHARERPQSSQAPRALGRLPLVGFVMAKKVCKSACKRNRARRRFREAYRKIRLAMVQRKEAKDSSVQLDHQQGASDNEAPALSERLRQTQPDQWYATVWVLQEKALTASWTEVEECIVDAFRKADQRFGKGKKAERK